MTAALAALNPAALVTLADCEQRIERGLRSFQEIGEALAKIRDSRLYKGTHETFEEYCQDRWDIGRDYADRMIAGAQVVLTIVSTGLPAPTKESQARALGAVPEPERADVWREANERTGGKPTAKVVTEIAAERSAPTEPERKPLGTHTPEPAAAPSTAPAGSGSTSPEPEPTTKPLSPDAQRLADEIAADSERRAAAAGIRSVLTYMTSRVLEPAQLAKQYVIALAEFTADDLRFAAETLTALAALKEQ